MMRIQRLLFLCMVFVYSSIAVSQNFTSSNLPIVVIETNGQTIPDEPKINVDMGIIYNGPGEINHLTDPFNEYDGIVGIERRGNTSQYFFPKKQYAVETRDSLGNNFNTSLLGLPEENDWILHAPYSDKTLMRNVLAYKLAGDLGNYASRTVYCEVVINGEYLGVYVLMEKIKQDENRVNITDLDEDDLSGDSLTGGYMVKIDKNSGVNSEGWNSNYPPYPGAWQDIFYQYHYPKASVIQNAQKQYIQDFIEDFESVMYSSSFNDPETGYPAIIDINSFANFILINELAKNVDAYRLSTFFYKDRNSVNSRLFAGPVWDINLGFGNADYYNGFNPNGWMINSHASFGDDFTLPFWWEKLMEDPAFYQHLLLNYNIYKQHAFHADTILAFIDSTANYLEEARERNFEKWPILGEDIWPNYFVGDTYEEELDYFKDWILDRLDWMDWAFKLQPIITEINYFSSINMAAGDWIEIYNPTDESINLSDWQLKSENDLMYTFPSSSIIQAQSYLVICENLAQFQSVFPEIVNCIGDMELGLNNNSMAISLNNSDDVSIDMLTYVNTEPWPLYANGTGNTIELHYYLTDNALGSNWHTSFITGGSPGEDPPLPETPTLFINELMADNESIIADEFGEYDDWIEIYNGSEIPIDVGGMYICDKQQNLKFKIPQSDPELTTIPWGGFLLLWADNEPEQGVLHLGFKLSSEADKIKLYMPNMFTIIDTVSFSEQEVDISFGRLPDGGEEWTLFEFPTPNVSNSTSVGTDKSTNPDIHIFPNPAKRTFKIDLPFERHTSVQLEMFDLYGRIVLIQQIDNDMNSIDVSGLQTGIYVLIIYLDGKKYIKKLTIFND